MKIPKYVINALHKRDKAAISYMLYDGVLNDWLRSNDLDIEYSHGHVETICGAPVAEETLRQIKELID